MKSLIELHKCISHNVAHPAMYLLLMITMLFPSNWTFSKRPVCDFSRVFNMHTRLRALTHTRKLISDLAGY